MNDSYGVPARALLRDGGSIPLRAARAETFAQRFLGLMGKPSVPEGCGLLFEGCRSIHMMFMRVPLDVLWLGPCEEGAYPVAGVSRGVRPWTVAFAPRGARHAMEFAAGSFPSDPLAVELAAPPAPPAAGPSA